MISQRIPRLGAFNIWRTAARHLLAHEIPPEQIMWFDDDTQSELFSETSVETAESVTVAKVPRQFLDVASKVVAHKSHDRFARLYKLLWRLRTEPDLLNNPVDADVSSLCGMVKNVSRDCHKMKAFVRFREFPVEADRRCFGAWFEPEHFIVELTGSFFANRFADMDWIISTPKGVSRFADGFLSFHPPDGNRHLAADHTEDLWRTYYANIFNPARLKIKAMQSEMPKKYWKNLPEAALIPDLVANAEKRVQSMREQAATQPSLELARIKAPTVKRPDVGDGAFMSIESLNKAARNCTRCALHCHATQTVCGEGSRGAKVMFVGEQPGDHEDIAGKPFVGPAGQIFHEALRLAHIDRKEVYLTNAVKHFKFTTRGKRRIHARPNQSEIQLCKWWLQREVELIKPELIVALGSTAVLALTGEGGSIKTRRGRTEQSSFGLPILVANHPSAILRNPEKADELRQMFYADIASVDSFSTIHSG